MTLRYMPRAIASACDAPLCPQLCYVGKKGKECGLSQVACVRPGVCGPLLHATQPVLLSHSTACVDSAAQRAAQAAVLGERPKMPSLDVPRFPVIDRSPGFGRTGEWCAHTRCALQL